MSKHTPGKLYLADQRGLLETPQHQRYCTFNFGAYAHEHKGAFDRLRGVNEEMLAGGHHQHLLADRPTHVLVLPITGEVQVAPGTTPAKTIDVGEIQLLTVPAGTTVQFTNPYPTDVITFLHLWLDVETPVETVDTQRFVFDAATIDNQLAELVPASPSQAFILRLGRFSGRHEAVVALQPGAHFFAFVVAGAFEVEGRLLHEKDGLALWNTDHVELEALSNNALVLAVTW